MNEFLANILRGINSVVGNYGWSMVIFTLIIKVLILPLDVKSRKSMRAMTAIQPQVTKLQKKYENDKEKLNQKLSELYRKEGVSPTSGCLPMIISMVVLFIMFAAMRSVANTEMAKQAIEFLTTGTQVNEPWLWIKNIWQPDSPFTTFLADQNTLKMIPADIWTKVYGSLDADTVALLAQKGFETAGSLTGEAVYTALAAMPEYLNITTPTLVSNINLLLVKLSVYVNNNGWFVLPILSAVTQYLMTLSQPQQPAADPSKNSTANFMKYFFPLFSLWICSSYNAIFALYWVVSNIYAWIQSIILNKHFENLDKQKVTVQEDSVK